MAINPKFRIHITFTVQSLVVNSEILLACGILGKASSMKFEHISRLLLIIYAVATLHMHSEHDNI
jgi:hypothetical protein